MNGFAIAKLVGGIVGSVCGGTTANIIIKELIPEGLTVAQKVMVTIGGAAACGAVAEVCSKEIKSTIGSVEELTKIFHKNEDLTVVE